MRNISLSTVLPPRFERKLTFCLLFSGVLSSLSVPSCSQNLCFLITSMFECYGHKFTNLKWIIVNDVLLKQLHSCQIWTLFPRKYVRLPWIWQACCARTQCLLRWLGSPSTHTAAWAVNRSIVLSLAHTLPHIGNKLHERLSRPSAMDCLRRVGMNLRSSLTSRAIMFVLERADKCLSVVPALARGKEGPEPENGSLKSFKWEFL